MQYFFCLTNIICQANSKPLPKSGKIIFKNNEINRSEKNLIHGQWTYFPDTLITINKGQEARASINNFSINVLSKKNDFNKSKYGTY